MSSLYLFQGHGEGGSALLKGTSAVFFRTDGTAIVRHQGATFLPWVSHTSNPKLKS